MAKKYLNVSYEDRDLAKRLGARWDPSVRRWYCMPGSPLAKIFTWRAEAKASANTDKRPSPHRVPPQRVPPVETGANFELPLAC